MTLHLIRRHSRPPLRYDGISPFSASARRERRHAAVLPSSKPRRGRRAIFQDIAPKTFCNDFAWTDPEPADRVLVYRDSMALIARAQDDDDLHFPRYAELLAAGVVGPDPASRGILREDGACPAGLLLFTVDDTAYFRCEVDDEALDRLLCSHEARPLEAAADDGRAAGATAEDAPGSFSYELMPVSELHFHGPRHRVFAGMVGYEYHVWYDTRRFCGRCGAPMMHGLPERMLRCPACGCMEFSRLFPAVIVGIVDRERDRVLVSRYAHNAYKRYALIAGFSEMGETVEQTVHREVMEEVGLKVKNLRYYRSQPWPPSNSLLFGFFCDLDGDDAITLDDHELEHAEWLPREDLPDNDADYSLTSDMMRVLREGREPDACQQGPAASDPSARCDRALDR